MISELSQAVYLNGIQSITRLQPSVMLYRAISASLFRSLRKFDIESFFCDILMARRVRASTESTSMRMT